MAADHPRSRGVYQLDDFRAQISVGSSPLARGLHPFIRRWRFSSRIIPARAGFTRRCCQCWTWFRDHPRSRGVYEKSIPSVYARPGSSPLARGLLGVPYVWGGSSRIIPARAGFTSPFSFMAASAMDHPRSRGVYAADYGTVDKPEGSSPLARGLLQCRIPDKRRRWIIPARAGFTRRVSHLDRSDADHPRSRGVYRWLQRRQRIWMGSSPLARGLPTTSGPGVRRHRIIPARAGFTVTFLSLPLDDDGSSPLARGLHHLNLVTLSPNRIIPARAGFTRAY